MPVYSELSTPDGVEQLQQDHHNPNHVIHLSKMVKDEGDYTPSRFHYISRRGHDLLDNLKGLWRPRETPFWNWLLAGCILLLVILICVNISSKSSSDCKNPTQQHMEKELLRIKKYLSGKDWELFAAIELEDEQDVKLLVQQGVNVNGRNEDGQTPLISAAISASNGTTSGLSLNIIKFLIEQGANPAATVGNGETFLHKLMSNGTSLTSPQFADLSKFLVSKNLTQIFNVGGSSEKVTPIMLAVEYIDVDLDTITLLHKNGVNLNQDTAHENSTLYYALAGRRSRDFLSQLVSLGANPNHRNLYHQNLLHSAASFPNLDGLKFLVSLKLEVNARDIYMETPLHWAVYRNKESLLDMVHFLLDSGADAKLQDRNGKRPLDMALELSEDVRNKNEVVRLLRQHS